MSANTMYKAYKQAERGGSGPVTCGPGSGVIKSDGVVGGSAVATQRVENAFGIHLPTEIKDAVRVEFDASKRSITVNMEGSGAQIMGGSFAEALGCGLVSFDDHHAVLRVPTDVDFNAIADAAKKMAHQTWKW